MQERRRRERFRVLFLVRLQAGSDGDWLVLSRDMSQTGALLAARPRLEVGDEVTLSFQAMPVDTEERRVVGTIVRVDRDSEHEKSYWPHRVAVEFREPVPGIEELLRGAAAILEDKYDD